MPYFFSAYLIPDEDGGFVVYAKGYGGVTSQGDTREEAIENIKEAFLCAYEGLKSIGQFLTYNLDELPPTVQHEKIDLSVRINDN